MRIAERDGRSSCSPEAFRRRGFPSVRHGTDPDWHGRSHGIHLGRAEAAQVPAWCVIRQGYPAVTAVSQPVWSLCCSDCRPVHFLPVKGKKPGEPNGPPGSYGYVGRKPNRGGVQPAYAGRQAVTNLAVSRPVRGRFGPLTSRGSGCLTATSGQRPSSLFNPRYATAASHLCCRPSGIEVRCPGCLTARQQRTEFSLGPALGNGLSPPCPWFAVSLTHAGTFMQRVCQPRDFPPDFAA